MLLHRVAVSLLWTVILPAALPGCTKRIDTSTEDNYYKTLTEVMISLPASERREFDDGMTMLWFYSESNEATNALIDGKTGRELLALIRERSAALPRLDTSSREAYESSLAEIKAGLPPSLLNTYDTWRKELPPYRPGNQKLEALNGMTFQKIIEIRNSPNR
jgi:hypothetical protein